MIHAFPGVWKAPVSMFGIWNSLILRAASTLLARWSNLSWSVPCLTNSFEGKYSFHLVNWTISCSLLLVSLVQQISRTIAGLFACLDYEFHIVPFQDSDNFTQTVDVHFAAKVNDSLFHFQVGNNTFWNLLTFDYVSYLIFCISSYTLLIHLSIQ